MYDHNWELGHRLSRIRKERGETLQEVASQVGISAQFLSMVEKGRSGIGLMNLKKLANYYSKPLSSLLDTEIEQGGIIHLDRARKLYFGDGIESRLLAHNKENEVFEPIFFMLEKGAAMEKMRHDGFEYVYVLDGVITALLEDTETEETQCMVLHKGDSIHYRGSFVHQFSNKSESSASFLSISTARILQKRFFNPTDSNDDDDDAE